MTALAGLGVGYFATCTALARDRLPRGLPALDTRDPWLHLGVAVDESIRLALELRNVLRPGVEHARIAAAARIAADRNREEGWLAHPERAHPIPPPLEKFHLAARELRGFGMAEQLCFVSEYEPLDPEIRAEFQALEPNRTAHTLWIRSRGASRPVLVFVHGLGAGRRFLDARALGMGPLCRELGLDLALFVLPLQGLRAGGRGLLDGNPLWTSAGIGQAVWDLRRLTGFLRSEGAPAVGVFGISIGGYVASVFASVEERLACAGVMNAPAALETLFWRSMSPGQCAEARASGLSGPLLENAWARHAPLRMRPRVPHEARLVVGGLGDRVVPPEQVAALWEHWGQPAAHWFPGTHVVWRRLPELRERLRGHLRQTLVSRA